MKLMHMNLKLNFLQAILLHFWEDVTNAFHTTAYFHDLWKEIQALGQLLALEVILSWCILVNGKQHLSEQCNIENIKIKTCIAIKWS